ncbi:MAG: MBL fold metallo-hydrolase [Planctomycetaceae bacterium]
MAKSADTIAGDRQLFTECEVASGDKEATGSEDGPTESGPVLFPAPEMVILGTGTSIGVPVVGCECKVCQSNNPRNRRMRSGVLVRAPYGEFVIDAGPELRLQLVRERAKLVRAAIMTHAHADHIMGMDDLRIFGYRLDAAVPIYCEQDVEQSIRQTFSYAFTDPETHAHKYAAPRLQFERVADQVPFRLLGMTVLPLRMKHGRLPILSYRFGNVAFCTDVSTMPASSKEHLRGLDVLVLNALRKEPHPTHLHLDAALNLIHQLQPKQAWLTHMSHEVDYEDLERELPPHVRPAYDGLRIPIKP